MSDRTAHGTHSRRYSRAMQPGQKRDGCYAHMVQKIHQQAQPTTVELLHRPQRGKRPSPRRTLQSLPTRHCLSCAPSARNLRWRITLNRSHPVRGRLAPRRIRHDHRLPALLSCSQPAHLPGRMRRNNSVAHRPGRCRRKNHSAGRPRHHAGDCCTHDGGYAGLRLVVQSGKRSRATPPHIPVFRSARAAGVVSACARSAVPRRHRLDQLP
jgi:hypothetical protein